VLFAEKNFSLDLAKPIEAATGVKVFALSHITGTAYSAEEFEVAMRENLETLAEAVEFTQR
jgi:zinc transport system substrate-binding protein